MDVAVKRNGRLLVLMLIFLTSTSFCLIPFVKCQETMSLKSIADGSVEKLRPDSNFGEFWKLQVSTATAEPGVSYAYVMFDLSEIPGTIQSAELSLFCDNVTETQLIAVHFCSDNTWTETGITWNNIPSFNSEATNSVVVTENNKWYGWDVTSDVKTASGTAGQKLTLVLVGTTTTEKGYVEFYSRDGIGGLRPMITITYEAAAAGFPVSLLIEVAAAVGASLGVAILVYFKFLKNHPQRTMGNQPC